MSEEINEPIAELIAQNIYETLSQITVANGYHFDLVVERLGPDSNAIGNLSLIINDCNPESTLDNSPLNYVEVTKDYDFELWVLLSKGSTIPLARYTNLIKSDIQKAMYGDIKRGGYADDTKITQDEPIINDDGKQVGMTYGYQVRYKYLESDPTKQ